MLVATVWAGIPGEYRQSLELANADGQGLALRRRGFSIPYRMGRIVLQTPIAIPAVPGEYLLRVALDDVVVSAQTVRVEAR